MRAVLDTNVLASGLLVRAEVPRELLLLWTYGMFELILSQHILAELERTLQKPYFRRRLTPAQLAADLDLLRREGTLVSITTVVQNVASHPQDDEVLATAISAPADYLVTGDTRLRQIGIYEGVGLLTPREFRDIVLASSG